MELWEILDKRWKIAKAANGYDDDEVQHQAYLKASEEERKKPQEKAWLSTIRKSMLIMVLLTMNGYLPV